jgi:thiol-disulfide isomerase/thioredoxin
MKIAYPLFFIVVTFLSCQESKHNSQQSITDIADQQFLYGDTEPLIQKFREGAQAYWDKQDSENALKYNDSIKALITDSYIGDYQFKTLDGSIYDSSNRTNPLFLHVTASWCAPCTFEIPTLNEIALKYQDQVDFVLLFWDNEEELSSFAQQYNDTLILIPSETKQDDATSIDISGFRHIMGFPTNYLITTNNQIIQFSQGASIPTSYINPDGEEITITEDEARKNNYERLEEEILNLIERERITGSV